MKIKSKKTVVALVAVGIIGSTSAANAFSLPAPIQQVWDATVGRVASSFSNVTTQYLGGLVDKYLPQGMSKVFGALGMPDPSGIFADIRSGKTNADGADFELPSSVSGENEINWLSANVGEAMGSGFFSEDSQEANKQANDALTQTAEASQKSSEAANGMNTTQEIMKVQSAQLTQLNATMAITAQQLAQANQQAAASNITGSVVSKQMTAKERRRQAELDSQIKNAAGKSAYLNGWLEEK